MTTQLKLRYVLHTVVAVAVFLCAPLAAAQQPPAATDAQATTADIDAAAGAADAAAAGMANGTTDPTATGPAAFEEEIGRASCRERV